MEFIWEWHLWELQTIMWAKSSTWIAIGHIIEFGLVTRKQSVHYNHPLRPRPVFITTHGKKMHDKLLWLSTQGFWFPSVLKLQLKPSGWQPKWYVIFFSFYSPWVALNKSQQYDGLQWASFLIVSGIVNYLQEGLSICVCQVRGFWSELVPYMIYSWSQLLITYHLGDSDVNFGVKLTQK